MRRKILIFSAGSANREVFQLIQSINKSNSLWEVIGYVDDDLNKIGKKIDGVEIFSTSNKPKQKEIYGICGVMDHKIRKKIIDTEIIRNGYQLTNLIHPFVEVPKCFKIGSGNIIFGNVHISFEVEIKNFSIISNFCDLGHNLIAGDYITMMPAVTVGGNCNIGEHTFIGAGAKIHQGIEIGKNCKIGMGSLITDNMKTDTSIIDHPRKVMRMGR